MEDIFYYILLARFLSMWKDNWESQNSKNPQEILKAHGSVIAGEEEGEGVCRLSASPTVNTVLNS